MVVLYLLFLLIKLLYTSADDQVLPYRIKSRILENGSATNTCHSDSILHDEFKIQLNFIKYIVRSCNCGGPGWTQVANINYSNASKDCPDGSYYKSWEPHVGGCRGDNVSVVFPVHAEYSMVCGKILAHQVGVGYAFSGFISGHTNFTSLITLTHGHDRKHIWTFAASWSENYTTDPSRICPCTNTELSWPYQIPSHIGQDYFCDTDSRVENDYKYFSLPIQNLSYILWDGKGCGISSTCCSFNNPPYFCKTLNYSTSDYIEMRMLNFNLTVFQVEIYVK